MTELAQLASGHRVVYRRRALLLVDTRGRVARRVRLWPYAGAHRAELEPGSD